MSATTGKAAAPDPEELIRLTKQYLDSDSFSISPERATLLSEDFIFRGPLVGPLKKQQFIEAVNGFKVDAAFPALKHEHWGLSVDPEDPWRVWWFSRSKGKMTGNWPFLGMTLKATDKELQSPPTAQSFIWTPEKQIKYMSVGYCVDRINSCAEKGSMSAAVVALLKCANSVYIWRILTSFPMRYVEEWYNWWRGKKNPLHFTNLPDWWKKLPNGRLRNAQGYYNL